MEMGETESAQGNHKKAVKHMLEALKQALELRLGDLSRARILYEIGVTFLLKKEQTDGMDYIDRSLQICQRVNGCQLLLFFIATLIGKLRYNEGNFQDASDSLQTAVDAAREVKYRGDAYAEALAYLCIAYKKQGLHDRASTTHDTFLHSLKRCDSGHVHANSTVQLLRQPTCEPKFSMVSTASPEFFKELPKATFCCCRYSSFQRWHPNNCTETQQPLHQFSYPRSRSQTGVDMKLSFPPLPRSPSLFLTVPSLTSVPSYCYPDSVSRESSRENSKVSTPTNEYRLHHGPSHPVAVTFARVMMQRLSSSPSGDTTLRNEGTASVRRCQSLPSVYRPQYNYHVFQSQDSGFSDSIMTAYRTEKGCIHPVQMQAMK